MLPASENYAKNRCKNMLNLRETMLFNSAVEKNYEKKNCNKNNSLRNDKSSVIQ